MIIYLKRNETTVKRAENYVKNRKRNPLVKNMLIIFIDSVSRAHMYRTMPKMTKWLEEHYKKDEDSESESYQFFRFHSTDSYTVVNLKPLYYGCGHEMAGIQDLHPEHIKLSYMRQGYILGASHNLCAGEFYEYYKHDANLINGRHDHKGASFACGPSYTDVHGYWSIFRG